MVKLNLCIILLFSLLILNGCSGCSDSSIRYRTIEQNALTSGSKNNGVTEAEQIPPIDRRVDSEMERNTAYSLEDLFEKHRDAVFLVLTERDDFVSQGSGFFVNDNGLGVSNYHVFEGSAVGSEVIKTSDGEIYKIQRVLAHSEEYDYIVFKLHDISENSYLTIASSNSRIGESVFAIGNPRGLTHTLSTGIISGYRDKESIIQTTTEITFGSSGGALMNMSGEVIGITTSGVGEANLNFAINIRNLNLERYLD